MESRFSPRPATVLGAGVAGHACTARVNSTKTHPCRDDGDRGQCGGVSTHLLSTVELPGKCDPRLAHPAESGYESRVCERAGKCPEISTIFALKHAHLPPIMNIGTKFPGKAAPHLGYQHGML